MKLHVYNGKRKNTMRFKSVFLFTFGAFLLLGSLTYGASLPALLSHCLSKRDVAFSQTGDTSQSAGLRFIEVRRSLRNRRETFPGSIPVAVINRFNLPALARGGFIPDSILPVSLSTDPDPLFHPPA
jgi:hypothetical protein